MRVFTSYFGNAKRLAASGIVLVSIARWQPKFLTGLITMMDVAPLPFMLKGDLSQEQYIECYKRYVLSKVDAEKFLLNLESLTGGRDAALCCYEKPDDFCHRHLLADWLMDKTGIEIKEFGYEPKKEEIKVDAQLSLFD